jgi:hypothetical protein
VLVLYSERDGEGILMYTLVGLALSLHHRLSVLAGLGLGEGREGGRHEERGEGDGGEMWGKGKEGRKGKGGMKDCQGQKMRGRDKAGEKGCMGEISVGMEG